VVATLAVVARADVLVLHSGKAHIGEVQSATTEEIVFRTRVDGVWKNLKFRRSKVKNLFEDAGDQSDGGGAAPERVVETPADPPDPPEITRSAPPVTGEPCDGCLVVIPLHGQVGGLIDGSAHGTFDVDILTHCLDRAAEMGAGVVVLDIQSPGGFLDAMEAICERIIGRHDTQRIIAYPGEALSAAAIISLTCREMILRPDSRLGAAVMVKQTKGGLSAVDAKMASPRHARQRQYMAASRRPYDLLAAMTIQESQLWWSPDAGFTADEKTAGADGYTLVDGETTVLTMITEDALRWGIADEVARTMNDLPDILGIEPNENGRVRVLDFTDVVDSYNQNLDRRLAKILEHFRTYFQTLSDTHATLGQLRQARRSRSSDDEKELEREVSRLVRRSQAANRGLQAQDNRLLAERADIPDALVDQLEKDLATLGRVGRLAREDTDSAARQAAEAVAGVLDRWRALLTF
jgi:ATP-dependent protease ClpP protease subunit